ncbi:TPA: hypothetical protein EYP44_03470, partial [Candidatus Bathyarchaeota archaeon]|nr:hypothetical protein [Candidatus Bathyarchaeota archaeon]
GYGGSAIRDLVGNGSRFGVNVKYVESPSGALSGEVEHLVGEDFLVLSADVVIDERIIKALSREKGVVYCYDSRPDHLDVEPFEKVLLEDGRVKEVGQTLQAWDGVYAGVCKCDRGIFPALKELKGMNWRECLGELARRREVRGLDVTHLPSYIPELKRRLKPFWFRIDDVDGLRRCKKFLVKGTQKGVHFTAYINKPIEDWLVYHLSEVPWITPHKLTVLTNAIAYLATLLFLSGHLLPAAVIAFGVGILDGLDGKLARVRNVASKLGSMEHSFDFLFEQSWYVAFSWALFRITGGVIPLALCVGILLADAFVRHCYMQFRQTMGIALTDYARFDRLFAKIDGRRNVYVLYLLFGVLVGAPLLALYLILSHSVLTAIIYALRACKHAHEADRGEPSR